MTATADADRPFVLSRSFDAPSRSPTKTGRQP